MKSTKNENEDNLKALLLSLTKRDRDLMRQELLKDVHELAHSFVRDAGKHDDAVVELWLQTLIEQLYKLNFVKSEFKKPEKECLQQAHIDMVTILIREMEGCNDEQIIDLCCSKLHIVAGSQSSVKKAFQDAYEPFKSKDYLFNTLKKGDKVELIFRILHG